MKWLKDDPEEIAERKAAFRDLREVELEDCGHMMHHDQPARLARLIEDFLEEGFARKRTERNQGFPPPGRRR